MSQAQQLDDKCQAHFGNARLEVQPASSAGLLHSALVSGMGDFLHLHAARKWLWCKPWVRSTVQRDFEREGVEKLQASRQRNSANFPGLCSLQINHQPHCPNLLLSLSGQTILLLPSPGFRPLIKVSHCQLTVQKHHPWEKPRHRRERQ